MKETDLDEAQRLSSAIKSMEHFVKQMQSEYCKNDYRGTVHHFTLHIKKNFGGGAYVGSSPPPEPMVEIPGVTLSQMEALLIKSIYEKKNRLRELGVDI